MVCTEPDESCGRISTQSPRKKRYVAVPRRGVVWGGATDTSGDLTRNSAGRGQDAESGCACDHDQVAAGDCDRVVASMAMLVASEPLLLDISDFAACRHVAIAPHHASATQCAEPEQPHQTHKT